MTSRSESNDFMSLVEVSKYLPSRNGKKIHAGSVWRWCRNGLRGKYLRYSKIGRRIVVQESDLHQFFAELAAADRPTTKAVRTRKPRRRTNVAFRQRQIESAKDVLRRAGILSDPDFKQLGHLHGNVEVK